MQPKQTIFDCPRLLFYVKMRSKKLIMENPHVRNQSIINRRRPDNR
jgi:hypothetical protein